MNQNDYFVSVIIPVYNGAEFLAQTVNHVLKQNYEPLEIIVIDDGSRDNTAEIAAQLTDKIRYFYQTNQGPASARNLGLQQAQGNVIAFLDVDDLWSDHKLASQLNYLTNHPDVDIVQGAIVKQVIKTNNCSVLETSLPYYYINLGSAIYCQSVFERVGLFDETMLLGDDVDWFVRAWEQRINKSAIDDVTLYYCIHEKNLTKGKNLVESGFVRVYKKHLERLRQSKINFQSLPAGFPSLIEYLGREPEVSLKNNKYTIIANDCWGAFTYKKLGHIYQTPLVGTRIVDQCYIKLLKNLHYYLNSPLEFPNQSQYDQVEQERQQNQYFFTALLGNEIEVHFYHEKSEDEARANWKRRLSRVNWDNIFVKFSKDSVTSSTDYWQYIQEFEKLNYPYKVCFTEQEYTQLSSTISLSEYFNDSFKLFNVSQEHFNIVAWLNKQHDSQTKKYIINK